MHKKLFKLFSCFLVTSLLVGCGNASLNINNEMIASSKSNVNLSQDEDIQKLEKYEISKNVNSKNLEDYFDSEEIVVNASTSELLNDIQYELIDGELNNNIILVSKSVDLTTLDSSKIEKITEEEDYFVVQYKTTEDAMKVAENDNRIMKNISFHLSSDEEEKDPNDLTRTIDESLSSKKNISYIKDFEEDENGSDVIVAILDSGFNKNEFGDFPKIELEELGKSFFVDDSSENEHKIESSTDLSDIDDHHGTKMATIVEMTSKNAKVLPIKVFQEVTIDDVTYTTSNFFALQKGFEYAIEQNANIINMSLGAEIEEGDKDTDAFKSFANKFIDAKNKGVYVCVSAGNETQNTTNLFPACLDAPTVVSALESNGKLTYYSNYGDSVDVAALGNWMLSNTIYDEYPGYNLGQGTSEASAYVSGLYSSIISTYGAEELDNTIEQFAGNWEENGENIFYGQGMLIPNDNYISCYTNPNLVGNVTLTKIDEENMTESEILSTITENENAINSITEQYKKSMSPQDTLKVGQAFCVKDNDDIEEILLPKYINETTQEIEIKTYATSSLSEETQNVLTSKDKIYIGKFHNGAVLLTSTPYYNKEIGVIDSSNGGLGWISLETFNEAFTNKVSSCLSFYNYGDENFSYLEKDRVFYVVIPDLTSDEFVEINDTFIDENLLTKNKYNIYRKNTPISPSELFSSHDNIIQGGQNKSFYLTEHLSNVVLNVDGEEIPNYVRGDSIQLPTNLVIDEKVISLYSDKDLSTNDDAIVYHPGDTYSISENNILYTYNSTLYDILNFYITMPTMDSDLSQLSYSNNNTTYSFDDDNCGIYDATTGEKVSELAYDTNYYLQISIYTNDVDSYLFDNDIAIQLNNEDVNITSNNYKSLTFTYSFKTEEQNTNNEDGDDKNKEDDVQDTKTLISSVSFNSFDGPITNEDLYAPTQVSQSGKCTISSPYFKVGDTLVEYEKALPDTTYTVYYEITPNENYYFDNTTMIKFGELGNMSIQLNNDGKLIASWTFEKTAQAEDSSKEEKDDEGEEDITTTYSLTVNGEVSQVSENTIINLSDYVESRTNYIPIYWTDGENQYALDDTFTMPNNDVTLELVYEAQIDISQNLPSEKTIQEESNVVLSVSVNNENVSYQWYQDSGNGYEMIENATSNTYTFLSDISYDGYKYYCKISTSYQNVNSNELLLHVTAKENVDDSGDNGNTDDSNTDNTDETNKDDTNTDNKNENVKENNLYQDSLIINEDELNYLISLNKTYDSYVWYAQYENEDDYTLIDTQTTKDFTIEKVTINYNNANIKCIATDETKVDTYIYSISVVEKSTSSDDKDNPSDTNDNDNNNNNTNDDTNDNQKDENNKIIYSVVLASDGNGLTNSSASLAEKGSTVTISATPNKGYVFDKWEIISGVAPIDDLTLSEISFTLDSDVILKACFVLDETEKDKVDDSNGDNKDDDGNKDNDDIVIPTNPTDKDRDNDDKKDEVIQRDLTNYVKNTNVKVKCKSASSKYNPEISNELSFGVEKDTDELDFIIIGGKELKQTDFVLEPDEENDGQLKLTLSDKYLKSLPNGIYTMKVYFTDKDYIETTFTVINSEVEDSTIIRENPDLKLYCDKKEFTPGKDSELVFKVLNAKTNIIKEIYINDKSFYSKVDKSFENLPSNSWYVEDLKYDFILVLSKEFFNTLTPTEYTLKIEYTNGSYSEVSFNLKQKDTTNSTTTTTTTTTPSNSTSSTTNTSTASNNTNSGSNQTQSSTNTVNSGTYASNNTTSNPSSIYDKDKGDVVTGDASNIFLLLGICSIGLSILYFKRKKSE